MSKILASSLLLVFFCSVLALARPEPSGVNPAATAKVADREARKAEKAALAAYTNALSKVNTAGNTKAALDALISAQTAWVVAKEKEIANKEKEVKPK